MKVLKGAYSTNQFLGGKRVRDVNFGTLIGETDDRPIKHGQCVSSVGAVI